MSLPESTEYWWGSKAPKERKQKTDEQIERKKEKYFYATKIRKAFKKEHPEMTRLQIIAYAKKIGGYKEMEKLLTQTTANDPVNR